MSEARTDIHAHSTAGDVAGAGTPVWLAERQRWFQDLKFGLFLHWGPYAQWGCIESWPLMDPAHAPWAKSDALQPWVDAGHDLDLFRQRYWALNRTFNPTRFDPGPWADLAWRAGMRYVCFTTKHHDGFSMYDTRATDYRITHPDCPFHANPRADVTKVLFDAFRRRGFAASCYFSKSDWHHPCYWIPGQPAPDRNPNYDPRARPDLWEGFVQFVHQQIDELMTHYGPFDILWLDGGQVRPPLQDIRMHEIAAAARVRQPGLLIADRTVGGPYENILTPEQEVPAAPLGYTWETCLTMGNNWAYKPDDTYKSARSLIHLLADIVAKDGNLLLNVGPAPDGTLPPEAVTRLQEIGDWMEINAAAIHGTRAYPPYAEGPVRYTRRGSIIFAIILAAEGAEQPPATVRLAVHPTAGTGVRLLGRPDLLAWDPRDDGMVVHLPTGPLPGRHAWVLQVNHAG